MEPNPANGPEKHLPLPPGTVLLNVGESSTSHSILVSRHHIDKLTLDVEHSDSIVLHPTPSSDPNDPLNWSSWRKGLNFGLTTFYVLFTFVMLDIMKVAFEAYLKMGISYETLNNAVATNCAGLAVGCLMFIPFVHKFGRRPLYMISSSIQLVAAIWSASLYTGGELIGANLLSGIGGATSETIVMITIVDLFFVHQHARFNGIFLLAQSQGHSEVQWLLGSSWLTRAGDGCGGGRPSSWQSTSSSFASSSRKPNIFPSILAVRPKSPSQPNPQSTSIKCPHIPAQSRSQSSLDPTHFPSGWHSSPDPISQSGITSTFPLKYSLHFLLLPTQLLRTDYSSPGSPLSALLLPISC